MAFRFNATKVLLTYAQCDDLAREDVFFGIDCLYPIKRFMIGEEHHRDGGRHIHAFFEFKKKLDCRLCDCFDINTGRAQHHPNIKVVMRGRENEERVLDYIQKEDVAVLTNIVTRLTWGEIRDTAKDAEDYLTMVEKYYPRDAALNWDRLKSYAEQQFNSNDPMTVPEGWTPHEGYYMPIDLRERYPTNTQSTVVIGPAGCGKTTWAKIVAPKPCLFCTHADGLKRLKPTHRSIIFDDMDFAHWPIQGQKFIVDVEQPREIHIRYKTVVARS